MRKISIVVASNDTDYINHLSRVLTERYADVFSASVASQPESVEMQMVNRHCDILIAEQYFLDAIDLRAARLVLAFCDGMNDLGVYSDVKRITKYQRISSLVSTILEEYSSVAEDAGNPNNCSAHIVSVWSPSGGTGKTTVALSFAAQRVAEGNRVFYLNLEPFSSSEVYFEENGHRSLSTILEKLNSNLDILLQSIKQQDSRSGIMYINHPDNYEDISILTPEDLRRLVNGCAAGTDEIVVDLGSTFDEKTKTMFEHSDSILLVTDETKTAQTKLKQFCAQSNVFDHMKEKMTLVCNRGARSGFDAGLKKVCLPTVQSNDPIVVFKTLATGCFC